MFTYVQKGWLCSTTQAMPMTEFLETGPIDIPVRLVLAHGAGGAMTSPFLETIADLLATRGIAVTRFEFAYMAARRTGCKRRPPPRAEALVPDTVQRSSRSVPRLKTDRSWSSAVSPWADVWPAY